MVENTDITNMVRYVVACVGEFASTYNICMKDAFNYLEKYKGIEFLQEFYDVEHTLSFEDVINDLFKICENNGGVLS